MYRLDRRRSCLCTQRHIQVCLRHWNRNTRTLKLWLKCSLCYGTMASPQSPLPSSTAMDLCRWWWESGGMASWRKSCCVMLMRAVRTHFSSPGCFLIPACPAYSDAVGSHTQPHLNDWSAVERFHPYLLRPIHVGGLQIASMPSARFFVLACLSFFLPLYPSPTG